MDIISLCPSDFLFHIVLLLPTTDVLSTSVLSKRWLNPWKSVPKVEFVHCHRNVIRRDLCGLWIDRCYQARLRF